ncbi:PulJ/GspJ family protein [Amycolatopsis alkalitolerans]|uniref:Prepilin-type N-terminal cleavage/methylation domain-containing protein n=1 Tax=Amycolatopsis alkalitolerans TaxID=2547244 RepID=A0A5C4M852_9PSEU|nr:prepilin-type N-terminal cleavage/methylation domain-containing protein [Amycolatopsis alkalitolerans]TNC29575.1 prepilin-type N-terminal cleavage/methylation domain-containing protein [Amycolatopsis alkalitolerans]
MRLNGRDGGFTLVELLLAITILGIITVPLTQVVLVFLRTSDQTAARLTESTDAQLSAAYFARDVASVGVRASASPYATQPSIDTTGDAGWPYPCGASGTTPVVRFAWDDYPAGATAVQTRVAYVVSADHTQLRRLVCAGSAAPQSAMTLARDLYPAAPPVVTCSSPCSGAPDAVSMTVTFRAPTNRVTPYTVTLTGQRRQS